VFEYVICLRSVNLKESFSNSNKRLGALLNSLKLHEQTSYRFEETMLLTNTKL